MLIHTLSTPLLVLCSLATFASAVTELVGLNAYQAIKSDVSKLPSSKNTALSPLSLFTGISTCRQEEHLGCLYPLGMGDKPGRDPPSSNGCGPGGKLAGVINPVLNAIIGATHCCDAHDKCYGLCGVSFEACNQDMLACMLDSGVDSQTAYTVFSAISSEVACNHFLGGTEKNCMCLDAIAPRTTGPLFYVHISSLLITQIASYRADTVFLGVQVLINNVPVQTQVKALGKHGRDRINFMPNELYLSFYANEGDMVTLSFIASNTGSLSEADVLSSLENYACTDSSCTTRVHGSFGAWMSTIGSVAGGFITAMWRSLFGSCDRITQQFDIKLTYQELLGTTAGAAPVVGTGSKNGFLSSPTVCHDHWRYWIDYVYGDASKAYLMARAVNETVMPERRFGRW